MSKLVLVFPTEESRSHWMTPRMLKRAGLGDHKFDTLVADDTILQKLNNGKWTTAVLFGEGSLNAVLNKFDALRWFNRTLDVYLKDRKVTCVPCLEPMHLLPYTVPTEEESKHKGMRHPPRYQGAVGICLRRAVEISEKGWPGRTEVDYLQDPTPSRFREWVDAFEKAVQAGTVQFLSWDIETPYKLSEDDEDEFEEEKRRMDKTILRISFSYKSHTAVSIPWAPEYLEDIKRLLAFDGRHVGWNAVAFDVPVMRANGIHVGGIMLDGMDAWHLLQSDLDKGLEHVTSFTSDLLPWKHLNDTMPALYSCIDADAALRNVIWIEQRLREQDMWERFVKEMEVMEILNKAGEHGNNVDEPFRLEMKAELEALLFEKVLAVQNTIAEKFKRRKFLVRLPKGANPADYGTFKLQKEVNCCSFCGKERVNVRHKCLDEKWEKVKVTKEKEVYYHLDPFRGVTELAPLLKKLQQNGFNPCSAHQMKLYMKAHRHPVGTNHKTKKETADVKHLKKLKAKYGDKHPIYAATLEIRLIQKALSTYVNGLEPDEQGLIHTSYVNSPSTWRLGSRNINVQNLGKRADNPHAKKARKIIVPRPGHVFVQADSSAIEAVMVGHFMGDENYIELARKGVHGYVTGKFLGESFTPKTYTAEDNDRIKHNNKALYDQFKQVNHGTNFGMGPYLMHMNDPEKFPHVKDAERIQDFIFKELPGLPKWHYQLRLDAQKTGYLQNPWGLRHYFYDVFNWKYDDDKRLILDDDGNPQMKLGKDSKRVIAFKPQSSAGFFMRDNVHILGRTALAPYLPAIVSIHDGYTVEVPDEEHWIDYARLTLGDILTRPIKEMNGLRIGCEIEIMRKNFLESEVLEVRG